MLAIGALICIRLGWGVFTAESKPVLPSPPQTSSPAATAPSVANDNPPRPILITEPKTDPA